MRLLTSVLFNVSSDIISCACIHFGLTTNKSSFNFLHRDIIFLTFHGILTHYCGLANGVDNSDIMNSICGCNWGMVLKTEVGFSHTFTFRMFTKFCQPFEETM